MHTDDPQKCFPSPSFILSLNEWLQTIRSCTFLNYETILHGNKNIELRAFLKSDYARIWNFSIMLADKEGYSKLRNFYKCKHVPWNVQIHIWMKFEFMKNKKNVLNWT